MMIVLGQRLRLFSLLCMLAGLAVLLVMASRSSHPSRQHENPAPPVRVRELVHRPAVFFEQNRGQLDRQVEYVARTRRADVFLTRNSAVFALRGTASNVPNSFSIRWADSQPDVVVAGEQQLTGNAHYFIGNDPSKWHTDVPTFGRIRYRQLYPGVDLVFYGREGDVEFDLELQSGAPIDRARLFFEGVDSLQLENQGDLVLRVREREVRQRRPRAYSKGADSSREIRAWYELNGSNQVAIRLEPHDSSHGVVIDPVLSFSTYLGGSDTDAANGIALDSAGNVYVAGSTISTNFPTASPRQATLSGQFDIFVTKFNPSGSALVYSTYLGGRGNDFGNGIAVDSAGNAYVLGYSNSSDFPTVQPLQATMQGQFNIVVSKLNTGGSNLIFSTYYGGAGTDNARAMALDGTGAVYIVGDTDSLNFPTRGPIQAAIHGTSDAFIVKMNTSPPSLVYSTYLGGSLTEFGTGIAVDGSGSAYIVGTTASTDFPTVNALQAAKAGATDVFVAKINAAGSALEYCTYLGGADYDFGYGIALDGNGGAVVVGQTASANFPTLTPAQQTFAGGGDAFVSKLSANGSSLLYSTFLGGSGQDVAYAVALDSMGNTYVVGDTVSPNFPSLHSLQGPGGDRDAFVSKLNSQGSMLLYSTYLGGADKDQARAIAVNSAGDAYVAGYTVSTNFPVLHAYQGTIDGGQDAFVVQIGGASALSLLSISPDAGSTGGNTAITLSGANFEAGAAVTIGGLAASNVNVVSGATITALTPARSPGPVDVSVTNPDAGTATLPMAYTYVDSKGNSSGGSTKGGCSASASASPIWIGLAALALSLAAARRRR